MVRLCSSRLLLLVVFAGVGALAGCDRKPTRVEVPPFSPSGIASAAIAEYDANGDGSIGGDELDKAPALKDRPELPMKLIDRNSDGQVSKDEISQRVQSWIDSKVGIKSLNVTVKMNGKPLEGAEVTLVPEAFMGGTVEEGQGASGPGGIVVLSIPPDKLPPEDKDLTGVRSGFYKVKVTHPSQKISSDYNEQTTLGLEVAQDSIGSTEIVFDVK